MYCPALAELPPPLTGKSGWPWTEESPQLPATMPDGSPWPKVSIVTPSYNQGQFLEETIRSVLLQGYPNLEYIIIDGGSTDNSVEIIRKYEPWLASWASAKDRGQSDAINKGWQQSTGEILAWLNSDDLYVPNALSSIVTCFEQNPKAVLISGACDIRNGDLRHILHTKRPHNFDPIPLVAKNSGVPGQPSVFLKRIVFDELGGPDINLHYVLDWEYWIRIGRHFPANQFQSLPQVISWARNWEGIKTATGVVANRWEHVAVTRRIFKAIQLEKELAEVRKEAFFSAYWRLAQAQWDEKQYGAYMLSAIKAFWSNPRYCFSRLSYYANVRIRDWLKKVLPQTIVRRLQKSNTNHQ